MFRDDAIWTTPGGRRLTGLEEIAAFTRQVLPGAFPAGETVDYEVVHILLIRPDVAAVKVRQQYRNLAGEATDGEGSPLYVMSKAAGRWLITAAQNTAVTDA